MTDRPTAIPTRDQLDPATTWDLEAIYATPEDWEADFQRLDALAEPVVGFHGRLDSPEAVAALFAAEDDLSRLVERLYTYAHLREDEDTANAVAQARSQRILAKYADIAGKTAWIEPEILARDEGTLAAWRDAPALAPCRRSMTVLLRRKPHVLSEKEETLLSMAAEIFRKPVETFGFLTNADMKFPDVEDETGTPQPLSNGRYITFLENRSREVRRRAFEALYDTYIGFKNTLASTLGGAVKLHNYNARIRRYPSALEASLHPDHIPVGLYESLVAAVRTAMPDFHDYVELRRNALGLDALAMYDLYVPIVPDFDMKLEWNEALDLVREACRPLGPEYAEGVEAAFAERWIDVHENKGKRSGAYSGGCYDTKPYILMNYQGTLDHVFTLAHELGHSMHSRLARAAQPYRYADYTIFVAEIASIVNETLLLHSMLERADDPKLRAYLLNHQCDQFKGTVFRQTMFAEFERRLHEMDATGEPLTAEALAERYGELNAAYQGPGVECDPRIAYEWVRIPHFYYNFYVYKYATGFCAAQVFARRILESETARDAYLDLLRGGGSDDPLELVRHAGVDLLDPTVLTDAFATFRASVRELRTLLA